MIHEYLKDLANRQGSINKTIREETEMAKKLSDPTFKPRHLCLKIELQAVRDVEDSEAFKAASE